MLIDTSQKTPCPSGLFVLQTGREFVTNRLERVPGGAPRRRRNPTYEAIAGQLEVLGKIR